MSPFACSPGSPFQFLFLIHAFYYSLCLFLSFATAEAWTGIKPSNCPGLDSVSLILGPKANLRISPQSRFDLSSLARRVRPNITELLLLLLDFFSGHGRRTQPLPPPSLPRTETQTVRLQRLIGNLNWRVSQSAHVFDHACTNDSATSLILPASHWPFLC